MEHKQPFSDDRLQTGVSLEIVLGVWYDLYQRLCFPVPIFSSLDKDQIKVVIDKVTQWLDLAEEGDQMTLPDISGRQGRRPFLPTWEHGVSWQCTRR